MPSRYTSPKIFLKLPHGYYALYDGRVSSEDLVVEHSNRYYKFYISSAIFLTKVNKKFLNMLYTLLCIVCQLPAFIDLI